MSSSPLICIRVISALPSSELNNYILFYLAAIPATLLVVPTPFIRAAKIKRDSKTVLYGAFNLFRQFRRPHRAYCNAKIECLQYIAVFCAVVQIESR